MLYKSASFTFYLLVVMALVEVEVSTLVMVVAVALVMVLVVGKHSILWWQCPAVMSTVCCNVLTVAVSRETC